MRILAISGSLRRDSHNTALLRAAAAAPPPGVEVEILDPDLVRALPPFDADGEEPAPPAVAELRAHVAAADALLFATPEYNSSIPGCLKNAVDWLSRPFATSVLRNMDVAVVGASTGMFGAVWAQAELRKVLAATGARVVDRELPVPSAAEAFTDEGDLAEAELRELLGDHVAELAGAAQATLELRTARAA
jgi:chromate reductase